MQADAYRFLAPRRGDVDDAAGDCEARIRASILPGQATMRRLAGALIIVLALALPFDGSAQSGAPPAEAESVWTRDTLGGDWGGLRSGLGQHGVQYDFWITGFYQGLFAGDGDDAFDFGGRADLLINASTEKLGLWPGGGLHAHLTYSGGSLQGFRGGALWPVNTSVELPLGTKDELVATSLYVSQRVGESTRLMLGKINAIDLLASHPFFGGWGIDRFWNIAFVAPPSGVVPPVIMGGILSHSFAPYALTLMVFDPNDQTTNYSPSDLFADGVNTSLGLSWSGAIDGRKSGAGITATYSTAEGTDYTTIGLPAGAETTTKQGSYNVAIEVSHLILESTQSPDKGLGVYAKAGIADGNPNPIRASFIGGLAGHAIVPGRPLDYFGVGYFFYNFSDELQDAVAPIGSFTDEWGVEAYYNVAVTPWLRVSADLQWINPATGANERMWVGGLRAKVAF
jgi:porin